MQGETIKISTKNKSSSIRISERTKKMLEALTIGKESHEQIILRIIKLANNLSTDEGTKLVERKNARGTKYNRINERITVETEKNTYIVVCSYNDLTIFSMLRKKQFSNLSINEPMPQWEIDLEIVNIKVGKGKWEEPKKVRKHDLVELLLVYLAVIKKILEKTFDVMIYEIVDKDDYLNILLWEKMYKKNNLSMESFHNDIEKKFKGDIYDL